MLALLLFVTMAGIPQSTLVQSNVTLTLHEIKTQPISGSQAYAVAVYLSLLDSAGNPLKDATAGGIGRDGEDACAQCAGEVQFVREVGTKDGDGEVEFFGVG